MPIQFDCECGKPFNVDAKHAGRKLRCPECGETLTVPGARARSAEPLVKALARAVRPRSDLRNGDRYPFKRKKIMRNMKSTATTSLGSRLVLAVGRQAGESRSRRAEESRVVARKKRRCH